ncbi:MAG: hypothetical protein IJ580_03245 [Prevotella sp.]|nr:hypothetical protein [Prevotella sp.]MBR1556336.1 hypothetical protein [Prevotella sp.]
MNTIIRHLRIVAIAYMAVVGITCQATSMRRSISPSQPAWIIHIDVWNHADPQKIIDIVPEDVRPFVIFNIATSANDDKSADGPAIYDSWMKVCAQNRVWTMIQCASGYVNRMPNTPNDVSAYEKYYQEYPNFIGFNFAEQYWGFDGSGEDAVSFDNRLQLFAKLLSLAKTYGGYLAVSFADSYYNANKMPIAYVKRNENINTFLNSTPEHFLCFEKYTQKKNFLFNESQCLGAWLSGIAGQYGIRFDSSGWVENGCTPDTISKNDPKYTIGQSGFVRAAGAIPVAEHIMLTGQTIMDGPELSWTECSTEGSTTTVDGYTQRNWEWKPQWSAITLSLFRKILDGTIRIPSKEEVMTRTKVCVVSSGSGMDNGSYRIAADIFDGLYRNVSDKGGLYERDDNHWLDNRWWTKSTGRYPTIPTMIDAGTLENIGRLSSTTKVSRFNELFPEEYTGDIYAGRHENGWVTYNPYQYNDVTDNSGIRTLSASTRRATGTIPFQYNTCTSVEVDYAPYSLGIMKEYYNKVTFYLQNYEGGTDIIKINGATSEPTYTISSGSITKTWENNTLTLSIAHSGEAVELTINCSGSATDRKTEYTTASISEPAVPATYTGILQYEAELADYKNTTIQKSGYNKNDTSHDGYKGQGFAIMSNNPNSSLRYHINVPESGYYLLTLRYQTESAGSMTLATDGNTSTMHLTANTEWSEVNIYVKLTAGSQTIDLTNTGAKTTYVDCIQLDKQDIATMVNESEGIPAVFPSYVTTTDINYTRTLEAPASGSGDVTIKGKDAKLYTICLPYKPTVSTGLKFYTLQGEDNGSLVFVEVSTVSANTPYLVAVTSGSRNIGNGMSTSVDLGATITDIETLSGYQMKGTLRGLTNSEAQGCYILQTGNVWGQVSTTNPDIYIPPFRAYIVATTAAGARLRSVIGEGTTGISSIQTRDSDGTIHWYDLNGRNIDQPTKKGIYIRNGKKIIIK